MQTSGSPCGACGRNILLERDGTWCTACSVHLHAACIRPGDPCPACARPWTDPSEHFRYARQCPTCFIPVDQVDACPQCGARARWDDENAYGEFVRQHRAAARDLTIEGWLCVIGGVFFVFAPGVMLLAGLVGPILVACLGVFAAAAYLIHRGVSSLDTARHMARFH